MLYVYTVIIFYGLNYLNFSLGRGESWVPNAHSCPSSVLIFNGLYMYIQDEWLECQRNWLYLESIFSAPDIQRQLPNEAKMFIQVDKSWKEIMRYVQKFPNCIKAGTRPGQNFTYIIPRAYI